MGRFYEQRGDGVVRFADRMATVAETGRISRKRAVPLDDEGAARGDGLLQLYVPREAMHERAQRVAGNDVPFGCRTHVKAIGGGIGGSLGGYFGAKSDGSKR